MRVEFEGRSCKFRVTYPPGMPFEQFEVMAWGCEGQGGGLWVEGAGENPRVELELADLGEPQVAVKVMGASKGQMKLLERYFRAVAEASIEAVWKQVFVASQQRGAGLVVPQIRPGNGNPR